MYMLLRFLQLILKNIPRKAGYFIFESFFKLAWLIPSGRRKQLIKNLSIIPSVKNPLITSLEVYKNYARYYFDLYYDKDKILPSVMETQAFTASYEKSKQLLESRKGLIIISMHMGNWDFAGSFLSRMFPGRTNVVVEKLSPAAYRWFTETRTRWGMKVIESRDVKSMMRALKNGEVLVLVADRDLEKTGYKLTFFGKKAYIPSGPAKLALAHKVPIMLGVMVRDKKNPMIFIPVLHSDAINEQPMEKNEENSEKLSEQLVSLMERTLFEYPEQWCMLQKVWVED